MRSIVLNSPEGIFLRLRIRTASLVVLSGNPPVSILLSLEIPGIGIRIGIIYFLGKVMISFEGTYLVVVDCCRGNVIDNIVKIDKAKNKLNKPVLLIRLDLVDSIDEMCRLNSGMLECISGKKIHDILRLDVIQWGSNAESNCSELYASTLELRHCWRRKWADRGK